MAQETRYSYETLHAFSIAVLTAAGAPDGHARAVADHLIDANLAGHDSHGAHRLMQYTDAIDQGGIDPKASPRTVNEGTTTAVLDATGVFGQVAGLAATELAVAKASEHGTAVVGVRGANHVGRAGVYALKMAQAGLVGQVYCSGRGAGIVAPWGGTTPLLSTNPIAVAVPTAGEPILVDITTSVTAEGKVRVARYAGKELAPGQILDRDGNPSTTPDDLYNGGSMLPLGGLMGHKGYGLSVVVDCSAPCSPAAAPAASAAAASPTTLPCGPPIRMRSADAKPWRNCRPSTSRCSGRRTGSRAWKRSCCPASRSNAPPPRGARRPAAGRRLRFRARQARRPSRAAVAQQPGSLKIEVRSARAGTSMWSNRAHR